MRSCIFFIVALTTLDASTFAADYQYRTDSYALSLRAGMGKSSLPLLRRTDGPGASAMASQLLTRFADRRDDAISTYGNYKSRQNGSTVSFAVDDGWMLRVHGDGTSAEYFNWPYRNAHIRSVPIDQQPTRGTLEVWGRTFIKEKLDGIISLGANETLVASHAMFEREITVRKDKTVPSSEETVGAIVVFSRTVDGIPVIGYGSKIAVRFTVDGIPWGFDYDWPIYATTTTIQEMLPIEKIRERQSRLVPTAKAAVSRVEDRFECGYFDVGIKHKDPAALIQGGCVSQHVFKTVGDQALYNANSNNGLYTSGSLVVTPAGATIAPDNKWREAGAIGGGRNQPSKNVSNTK